MRTALDSAAEIRLVVNADDFGMSPAISRGILRAHREGIVTSTSLLGNCADLDGRARDAGRGARAGRGRAPGAGAVAARSRTPPRVPSLLAADGALSRARRRLHRRLDEAARSTPADVEREFDAQVARVRDAGIAIDHLDTHHHLGFLPVVGRAVEAVARRHGIAGHPQRRSRRRRWRGSPTRGAGSRPACSPASAWLTRRQLGARRHGAAELGLRRDRGASTRCASWRSSGASARARTSSSATRARSERATPVYDHARRAARADVARRCGARSGSAASRSADGAICFERRARQPEPAGTAAAAARALRARRRRAWPS